MKNIRVTKALVGDKPLRRSGEWLTNGSWALRESWANHSKHHTHAKVSTPGESRALEGMIQDSQHCYKRLECTEWIREVLHRGKYLNLRRLSYAQGGKKVLYMQDSYYHHLVRASSATIWAATHERSPLAVTPGPTLYPNTINTIAILMPFYTIGESTPCE